MRFIHIADLHLGAVPDEGKPWSERRKQELWDNFAEVIALAEKEKIDFLLISGDVFQRQPLLRELKEVNYLFSRIPRTKVVFIAGNHDYVHPNSYYRTFQWEKNVFFLGAQEVERVDFMEDQVSVYGASYWRREIREPIYDKIEDLDTSKINILLVHGGDAKHIPFSPEKLVEKGFDYVACGHIHKPGVLVKNRVIMAGTLQPSDPNDTGQHGYWMGEMTKQGVSVEFYPIRKCEYVHFPVAVHAKMTNGELQEKIAEVLSYAEPFQIYKFILSGKKDPDMEFDLKAIEQMDQVISVTKELVPDYDFDKLKENYENQMIGKFIHAMENMPEDSIRNKALYYGVDALCKTMRQ
ncbi:MAG: DNA repair exonuclease [Lachnospiraceae bacterium]|nr:DNA repair exonuclease [Lachnospiraceae bacterium]